MVCLNKEQKQQHMLIQAFSRVAPISPNWRLEIWGEEQGDDIYTNELKNLIKFYHLENRVFLYGVKKMYCQSI